MKKILLALLLFAILGVSFLSAQPTLQGINYQGVARDATGNLMTNTALTFKISLVSKDAKAEIQPHYTETHKVNTDDLGLFHFVIGSGEIQLGAMGAIPWAEQSIFLQTEMASAKSQAFDLLNLTELLAVPYAYYAATANQLVNDPVIELADEKNQSIYWTTGGNSSTRPPTHFLGTLDKQPLVFKTNNIESMRLDTIGRLLMSNRTPAGPDNLESSYPMVVKGTVSTQGIWIEIKEERSKKNNFLTFADDVGIQGRVEGQTLDELLSSDNYIYQTAIFTINGVALAGNIVAVTAELIANVIIPWKAVKAPPLIAKIVTYTIQAASLLTASITWDQRIRSKVGVAYSSGNGDYAEWLQRAPGERNLQMGEIVGLNGGQISLNTQDSKQLLVVSHAPIALGNEPKAELKDSYEKVAFLGQVLVKVAGTVKVGDYILPSGHNDGCGVAVSPDKMLPGDYDKIVGVAWEAADQELINFVNVAVGINSNDLAEKVDELDQRVSNIMDFLDGKTELNLSSAANRMVISKEKPSTAFGKLLSDEAFDQYLDKNKIIFTQVFSLAQKKLVADGVDPSVFKNYEQVFADPIKAIKTLRRDPKYLTLWNTIDKNIHSK